MEICDDQTNSVLNQVDAFRSSWISTNEKLRDANNKIESLEAELSIMKNQLYKTTYQRDILNYTLKQLYSSLRADCKIIDQVQRNLSSFVRVAEHDSTSESPEQNAIQNLLGLNSITGEESNALNSSEHSQVNPSILNNRPNSSRTKHNKPKVNFAKELGLVTLPPKISTRKPSNLSDVSGHAPISSQRNQNRGTAMLLDALSNVNGTVTPAVNNKRRSRKLNNLSSKCLTRDRGINRDSNDDICDVIVIDYSPESETKTADVNEARDVQIIDGDNCLHPDSSTFLNQKVEENGSNWMKIADFDGNEGDVQQEDRNDALDSNNSAFPTEGEEVDGSGSNSVKTADSNNTGNVQQGAKNNGSRSNDLICISSDEADHQEDDDNCSCLNEPIDILASPPGVEIGDEDYATNLNKQASLDSVITNEKADNHNFSSQDAHNSVSSSSNKQDDDGFTVHTQNEELENIAFAAKNNIRLSAQKRSHQNEEVDQTRTRKKKKLGEVAKPIKEKDEPKRSRKSLEISPFVSKLHSTKNTSSLPSTETVSKFSKNKKVSKKYSVPKKISRTFICKFCNETFENARKVSRHVNHAHADNEDAWTCQVCGFVTATSKSLASHASRVCYRRLTRENGTCLICQKENPAVPNYIAKSVLDVHILNNHPHPYPDYLRCPFGNGECIQHFTSLVAHDRHVQTVHKDEDLSLPLEKIFPGEEFWTCAHCGKVFMRSSHLMQHAIQAHPADRKVFCCGLCNFVTAHPRRLQAHLNKHSLDTYNYNEKGNKNITAKQ